MVDGSQKGRCEWRAGQTDAFDPSVFVLDQRGLIPVVSQDRASGAVLMVAWANVEALARTAECGVAHFFSRSRQALWRKGETSGNELLVHEIRSDCDRDTVLYRVDATGPACHTGERTCFQDDNSLGSRLELGWLADVISERARSEARGSYTRRLLDAGSQRVAQKVGEEAVETVISGLAVSVATSDQERLARQTELVGEAADLLFHLLVLLEQSGVATDAVAEELRTRHRERAGVTGSGAEE